MISSDRIFLSYRRKDAQEVRWLPAALRRRFGDETIFVDQVAIRPGTGWRKAIDDALAQSRIFILVVTSSWERLLQEKQAGAQQDPTTEDEVVREVRAALAMHREGRCTIIPYFVGRGGLANPFKGLPAGLEDLAELGSLQAINDTSGVFDDAHPDVRLLDKVAQAFRGEAEAGFAAGYAPPPLKYDLATYQGMDRKAAEIRAKLCDSQVPARHCIAIRGVAGTGKSTLATMLFEDPAILSAYPDGRLWARMGPDANARLALIVLIDWARDLGLPLEPRLTVSAQRLMEWIASKVNRKRLLIVIDDVFDQTLADLLRVGSPSTSAYIFTSRRDDVARHVVQRGSECIFPLSGMDSHQAVEFVRALAPDAFTQNGNLLLSATAKVVSLYAGVPKAVELLGLALKAAGTDTVQKKAVITKFAAGGCLEDAIRASVQQLDEADQVALTRLSALQPDPAPFSLALARRLLGTDGTEARATLSRLRDAGLLEVVREVSDHNVDNEAGEEEQTYSIHQSIATELLPLLGPDEAKALRSRAVEHFGNRLLNVESGFEDWFKYENSGWQRVIYALRFYVVRANDFEVAAFELTRVWMSAFWWWCTFTNEGFDFCDRLLEDWPVPETPGQNDWAQELDDLRDIQHRYPNESSADRRKRPDDWQAVRGSLQRLGLRRRLNGEFTRLSNAQCDYRGLLSMLLAETYRFGEARYDQALEFYADAVVCFEREFAEDPEFWNLSWARFHLADCRREAATVRGDAGLMRQAHDLCKLAIASELGKKQPDQEVVARLKGLGGIIAARQHHLQDAAADFFAASFWAYRYQAFSTLEKPNKPDAYTVGHYWETAQQVAAALIEHHQGKPAARAEAERMAQEIARRWKQPAVGKLPVAAALASSPRDPAAHLAKAIFPPAFDLAAPGSDEEKSLALDGYGKDVVERLSQIPEPKD